MRTRPNISDLVTDPDVKTALEAVVREYEAEEGEKWATKDDKCPVNCGAAGAGTCATGQSSCTCKYKGIVGRMRSGFAPMSVRGTFTRGIFTNIHGNHHEARTLKCDGKLGRTDDHQGNLMSRLLLRAINRPVTLAEFPLPMPSVENLRAVLRIRGRFECPRPVVRTGDPFRRPISVFVRDRDACATAPF